jgi:pimeloyl-ACP methyl ester carboxylesterase
VDHDLRGKLDQIDGEKCPVVMLTGDYDYLTTPEDGQRTASQIKGGEFIEMKGIGHFPMSENHELFREYLQQALQRIESKVGARAG